ncbi:MFS transporter [Streptosporangium sp. NPDC051022]|uniref:MFS transporter n=1 Tax=Streptosporangium sp. NPDC051022 TaxID=3155752 RepID=UPI00342B788E
MKHSLQETASSPMPQTVPLRRQRDYRLLLSARITSETGGAISLLAVPLTAAALLGASPAEMGALTAAASLPFLMFGLQAGAIADRLSRHRPVMIACEAASALAMATIPFAWGIGVLTVPWLIATAFVVGTATVIFRAASFPHLTVVVPENQRTEALAGMHSVYSLASVCGPGLAGLLVQLFTAPFAILFDAVSFLVSAFLIKGIRAPENHTPPPPRGMWTEIHEGLRAVTGNPALRALCGCGAITNFFAAAYNAVFMIYALTELRLPAGLIGVLFACFGVGGLAGAAAAPRLAGRFGENRVLACATLFFPLNYVIAATAAPEALWATSLLLAVSGLVTGMAILSFAVCFSAVVLRETPAELRGRVNATNTFTVQGVLTLGGLAGGLLGELLGLRPVLWIGAAGVALTIPWIWLSPLGRARAPRGR